MYNVKKAIIPAAGLGTRFLPITKALPKPMLPVVDKPNIQYIMEELKAVGISDVIVVVSPDSDIIAKHFAENKSLKERLQKDGKDELLEIEKATETFNVKFVVQEIPNGLAGAILCAEKYVDNEPFALLLGDELLYAKGSQTPCIKKLVDTYKETGKNVIATMQVFGDDVSKYGNIGIADENERYITVNGIIEKPSINDALSNNAIIGRYVLNADVFKRLKGLKPRNNEIYLTDVLDEYAKEGNLLACTIEDERYDVGDKLGYIKANVEFALKNEKIKDQTAEFIKDLAKKL